MSFKVAVTVPIHELYVNVTLSLALNKEYNSLVSCTFAKGYKAIFIAEIVPFPHGGIS